jgi:hypothetical protein
MHICMYMHTIGNTDDNDFRVWDVNTRTLRQRFCLHNSTILKAIKLPNLSLMVTASADRYVI